MSKQRKPTFLLQLFERCELFGGDMVPTLNFAADLLRIASNEASGWTNRYDDAMRLPDVLAEAAEALREESRYRYAKANGGES